MVISTTSVVDVGGFTGTTGPSDLAAVTRCLENQSPDGRPVVRKTAGSVGGVPSQLDPPWGWTGLRVGWKKVNENEPSTDRTKGCPGVVGRAAALTDCLTVNGWLLRASLY